MLLERSWRLGVVCLLILIATAVPGFSAVPAVVIIEAAQLSRPLAVGQQGMLAVEGLVAPGWHINSNHPTASYFIPTRLTAGSLQGFKIGEVVYPPAQKLALAFESGQKLSVYSGQLRFGIPITPQPNFEQVSNAALTIRIDYQACNDRECLRPVSVSKTFPLALIRVAGRPSAMYQEQAGLIGERNLLTDSFRHGYLLGFLVVLLAGLALNLTPCVYPLIGVTIAYFGLEGGGPRRVVLLALLYVLGIALTFSTLGAAAALSGGLFGAALQNPYVLGAIAAMLLVLAAASFGLIQLQPPAWLMQRAGNARPGFAGALVMGLGMGVVAAPCIGPIVLGLLLLVQQSASAILGFSWFFTLALGLGLPYVALAVAAGSIRRLPRSGEWLAWVEQLLGFILVGLALYFLDPLVPDRWISRILPYYGAGAGIFLGFVSPAGRKSQPFLIIRSGFGIASVAVLAYLLLTAGSAPAELSFRPFDAALLQMARAHRKPVVVDFSADWCVPCREMEHTTFADPTVLHQAGNFIWLKANLTAPNQRNAVLIKQFKVAGVPTTLFIDADGRVRASRAGYIGPREFLGYLRLVE
jgi:thioredoxin:protein disulfide reductase